MAAPRAPHCHCIFTASSLHLHRILAGGLLERTDACKLNAECLSSMRAAVVATAACVSRADALRCPPSLRRSLASLTGKENRLGRHPRYRHRSASVPVGRRSGRIASAPCGSRLRSTACTSPGPGAMSQPVVVQGRLVCCRHRDRDCGLSLLRMRQRRAVQVVAVARVGVRPARRGF